MAVIETEALTKRFGTLTAVAELDLAVERGEIQFQDVVVIAGLLRLERLADRLGLANHAEEHPRLRQLAGLQVQLADL
ncbi:MAG TPA: hypothetical protein PKA98_15975, partial [Acidimicrobiales bacterium]|nr:hypothetical protein [Acidimicrobiales bacterium]